MNSNHIKRYLTIDKSGHTYLGWEAENGFVAIIAENEQYTDSAITQMVRLANIGLQTEKVEVG